MHSPSLFESTSANDSHPPGQPRPSHVRKSKRKRTNSFSSISHLWRNSAGFALLGPVLVLATLAIGIGLLGVRNSLQSKIDRQIKADRQTGKTAHFLKIALERLQGSYSRLNTYRKLTLAACPIIPTPLCPEAKAAFLIGARAEQIVQRAIQIKWLSMQAQTPLMSKFSFRVASGDETDLLTDWAAHFKQQTQNKFYCSVYQAPVSSTATVWRENDVWHLAWTE